MEPNTTPSTSVGGTPTSNVAAHEKSTRFKIALLGFFLFIVFVVGLFWMITTPELTVGLTLSFVAGLSMIFLPCTLPLAFVIVPLTMDKTQKPAVKKVLGGGDVSEQKIKGWIRASYSGIAEQQPQQKNLHIIFLALDKIREFAGIGWKLKLKKSYFGKAE